MREPGYGLAGKAADETEGAWNVRFPQIVL